MARRGGDLTGVDFSRGMIDFAAEQEDKERLGIDYHVADACNLELFERNTFDIVTCFMALQDIEQYENALKEVSRILKRRGRFIFVIPHPCFERRLIGDTVISGWEYEKGTESTSRETTLYFKIDRYFDAQRYTISWNMERLSSHFKTTTFHRTLSDYVYALHEAGLAVLRLKEPRPTRKGLSHHPMKDVLRIPQSIVIETQKAHF